MIKKTFKKSERLHRKKHIQELFAEGSSFYSYPFKILCVRSAEPDAVGNQVLVSVSKRHFKLAADRNKIKRRMREAYRLNKTKIQPSSYLHIAYIYTPKRILSFEIIQKGIIEAANRLSQM